jgi:cell pole-organizing protein PopZ
MRQFETGSYAAPKKGKSIMNAYLEITLKIQEKNRPAAAEVYSTYRQPFLDKIKGATSKALLVRDADVQVLHGFDSLENAQAYLKSQLFNEDVVTKLKPLLDAEPEVRFYTVAA